MDRQVDLLSRHFRQDEMLAALKDLMKLVKQPPPKQRNPSAARTATKAQAEDMVAALIMLGDKDMMPRFLVQSDDLPRVLPLLGALSVGDEQAVAARLEALEASQKQHMMDIKRMMMNNTVTAPAAPQNTPEVVVTRPSYADTARGGDGGGRVNTAPPQFLQRLTRAEEGGRVTVGRGRTERSRSGKRQRLGEEEGEWQEVTNRSKKNRERPKAASGTADMAEFPDLAALLSSGWGTPGLTQ